MPLPAASVMLAVAAARYSLECAARAGWSPFFGQPRFVKAIEDVSHERQLVETDIRLATPTIGQVDPLGHIPAA
jgi:hypothetical protein